MFINNRQFKGDIKDILTPVLKTANKYIINDEYIKEQLKYKMGNKPFQISETNIGDTTGNLFFTLSINPSS